MPPVDPRLIAQLRYDFDMLTREMARVQANMAILATQLYHLTAPPQPVPPQPQHVPPVPVAPPGPWPLPDPAVQAGPVPPAVPQSAAAYRPGGPYTAPLPAYPPPGRYARPPAEPWWQREGMISRLLAIAGVAVTLIGVALLLVLAANAGFFGPVPRVVAGALLAAVLVAAAVRVHSGPGGRIGAIALAATGVAAAYLDVVAMTTIFHWLPGPAGLALATVVVAAGVVLALCWRAQELALLVIVPVAVLAPVITSGVTLPLVGFLIVLQIGVFPVHLLRQWPIVQVARTIPVVLVLMAAIQIDMTDPHRWQLLAAASVVAAFATGSSIVTGLLCPEDVAASVMLGIASLPLLTWSIHVARVPALSVQLALAAVLLVVAAWRSLPGSLRLVAALTVGVALFSAAFTATAGSGTRAITLLVIALGYLAATWQTRNKAGYTVGVVFTVLGGLMFLQDATPDAVADSTQAVAQLGWSSIVGAVLLLAALGLVVIDAHRLQLVTDDTRWPLWIVAGIAGLYTVTAGIVAAAVDIGRSGGFTIGHSIATIVCMVGAGALLLYARRKPEHAKPALFAGLTIVVAALAKLFLFDLATLDGLTRVAAFIGVGLLLLGLGTRYARSLNG